MSRRRRIHQLVFLYGPGTPWPAVGRWVSIQAPPRSPGHLSSFHDRLVWICCRANDDERRRFDDIPPRRAVVCLLSSCLTQPAVVEQREENKRGLVSLCLFPFFFFFFSRPSSVQAIECCLDCSQQIHACIYIYMSTSLDTCRFKCRPWPHSCGQGPIVVRLAFCRSPLSSRSKAKVKKGS